MGGLEKVSRTVTELIFNPAFKLTSQPDMYHGCQQKSQDFSVRVKELYYSPKGT